jgi:alpha-L-fucosidase
MVAFFAGRFEGSPDVGIWSVTRKNEQWTEPILMADGRSGQVPALPCWNPVLFRSTSGTLFLFYKVGKNPREWFGRMKSSPDEGCSWTEPVELPAGIIGPVKNKPVELPDGKLLCPSSTENEKDWKVQMELFDPRAKNWHVTKVDQESPFQVIQPAILVLNDSTYRILCRSKSDLIITSESKDYGLTWSNLAPSTLPNPNSGIDAVTLRNGTHLLVYNPLVSGREWMNGRNRLNLAWSADGLTWTDILVLENEQAGEFSYPAIIQSRDGLVHLTYTYNRTQMKYWKIRL